MNRRNLFGLVFAALGAVACAGGEPEPCRMLEGQECLLCNGEMTRCSFDGVEVTEPSCEGCQARVGVMEELCAAGSTATREAIESGITCETVDTDT